MTIRRGTLITLLPFALVFALAIGMGVAARLVTPEVPAAAPTAAPGASAVGSASPPPAGPSAAPGATDAAAMLRAHNELRLAVAAPAVRADDRVTAAAQRHAEYLARNDAIGHEESSGGAGFTGVTVRDRLAAQGYPDANASEVATSAGAGTDGVRSLWDLPYHRLGLMHPHAVVAGWGHATVDGRSRTVGVIVYDFASAAPERVRSPAAGQRVSPSWHGEEFPDVLPAGAARPVGYPVMVVYDRARPVALRTARLTDAGGRVVDHHVVPQIYERDYVSIVPARPLDAGARYRVRLELRVGDADVVEEWEFTTAP